MALKYISEISVRWASSFAQWYSLGKSILLPTQPEENVSINLLQGDALIEGRRIAGNTAVHFGEGDAISITAPTDAETRFIFLTGNPLHKHK